MDSILHVRRVKWRGTWRTTVECVGLEMWCMHVKVKPSQHALTGSELLIVPQTLSRIAADGLAPGGASLAWSSANIGT
jgi:hypothetical protein